MAKSSILKVRLRQPRIRRWHGSSRAVIYRWLRLVVQLVRVISGRAWWITDAPRHRPLCGLRKGIIEWWSSSATYWIQLHRYHAVLHRPRIGWNGCPVSRGWILLRIFNAFPRSCVGFRNGMELLFAMADCFTAWDCGGGNYCQVLAFTRFASCVGCSVPGFDNKYQFFWRSSIRRSRIRVLYHQSYCSHWFHVSNPRLMR